MYIAWSIVLEETLPGPVRAIYEDLQGLVHLLYYVIDDIEQMSFRLRTFAVAQNKHRFGRLIGWSSAHM
jgi:hypothetical protein